MRKTPQEKGFIIPVKRKIGLGRYQKAWAKTLDPDRNGVVHVCYDNGKRSTWLLCSVIPEPQGFDVLDAQCYECGARVTDEEHYLNCSLNL